MGKSIRAKIKKRLRTAKRQRVDAMIVTPRENEHFASLQRTIEGKRLDLARPKNAFKFPNSPGAVFPQHEVMKPIDFRAESMPMVGYVFRGNRRKYAGEEAEYLKTLAKTHPKMEVLAGGGAVVAATGQKVTSMEAQLLAGAVKNTADAGSKSRLPTAAEAVAAAVAAGEVVSSKAAAAAPDVSMAVDGGEAAAALVSNPTGSADHTRRPVLKDSRRQERAAEHRPRAKKSAGKKRAAAAEADLKADAAAPVDASANAAPVAAASAQPVPAPARQETPKQEAVTPAPAAASQDVEMPEAGDRVKTKKKTKLKAAAKAASKASA